MKPNLNRIDRNARLFLIAPIAAILAFVAGVGSIAGIILLVVAGAMIATALVGFCPLYRIFGISTCARKAAQ